MNDCDLDSDNCNLEDIIQNIKCNSGSTHNRKHTLRINSVFHSKDEEETSHLVTTKLTDLLNKKIKITDIPGLNLNDGQAPGISGGIKLFASSEVHLNDEDNPVTREIKQRRPDILKSSRKMKLSSDSDDEDTKLASVVVSADWILSGINRT